MRIFQNLRGKQLKYYNSLDKLKILTFWDILKEKNPFLLDMEYYEGKKYTKKQENEINDIWLDLYDEFFIKMDNSKSRVDLSKSFDELILRHKINKIVRFAEVLQLIKENIDYIPLESLSQYEQEIYDKLVKFDKKIKPKYFDGIDVNLKNLDKVLKSYINKYNQDYKKDVKDTKELDIYDVVVNAESWLDGKNLDIENMVASKWISYMKQINRKKKAQDKNKLKNG